MIKFAKPSVDKSALGKIKNIFKSGIFVHGYNTLNFERKLSNFFKLKTQSILSTASCTSALHLYYISIGLKKGDEVIMSAQTHVATAHAVEICGAKPVFVDCELETGNINIDDILNKINKKTVCICVTHFLGKPTNMFKILKIAKKYNLKVVEDTALSIGSKINGKYSGTFGDAGAFSFHPVKIITTGEGGALILKNKKVYNLIKSLRSFGYDIADPQKRKIPGNYNINYLGLNYRLSEIEAAIGLTELSKIKNKISTRKKNYHLLYQKIKMCKNFIILDTGSSKKMSSSYYALTIVLKSKSKKFRNSLVLKLKEKGIQTSIYYPHPVPLLNYYRKKYNYKFQSFRNSNRIAYNSISFSIAPHIKNQDIEHMSEEIKNLIG
ncbi:MAG: hypothetical protein CMI95_05705 [Pelagibacteraceae bacterium]|nr:hypothetical protein [Pelagibacteraceae bacterium]|tara:strand:- start:31056 stop:32198 length:1143 start_codon:yes stop_codon:yes gene_type:complete